MSAHFNRNESASPIPVKVVISGGFGVGKTTAVAALSEIDPLNTEGAMTAVAVNIDDAGENARKNTTTVAMDFGRVTLDDSIVLYLFGTPGQERFGFMWKDISEGALGAIVIIEPSRIQDSYPALDYFDAIKLPYIVAVNNFVDRENMSLNDVREAADLDNTIPVVTMDARVRDDVKNSVLALLTLVLRQAQHASQLAHTRG